jgi:hypothetical protein
MKLRTILTIGLLSVAGFHQAFAQGAASTASQVRADLAEAVRTGDILGAGELGLPLNQLHPHRYPAMPRVPGKPREQVKAELAQALHAGDLLAGESSYKLNEVHPNLYPPVAMVAGTTREAAKLELAQAIESGEIIAGGELALKRNELSPRRYAPMSGTLARGEMSWEARRGIFSLRY